MKLLSAIKINAKTKVETKYLYNNSGRRIWKIKKIESADVNQLHMRMQLCTL
jgi:hypothetical protein